MILLDTSIWVDHLRHGDPDVATLLDTVRVLAHPFVIGELALGHLRQRRIVLDALQNLPKSVVATDSEVLHFIERNDLTALGIGYVDVHLLAAARLTGGSGLWTRDKRLGRIAEQLGLATGPIP